MDRFPYVAGRVLTCGGHLPDLELTLGKANKELHAELTTCTTLNMRTVESPIAEPKSVVVKHRLQILSTMRNTNPSARLHVQVLQP